MLTCVTAMKESESAIVDVQNIEDPTPGSERVCSKFLKQRKERLEREPSCLSRFFCVVQTTVFTSILVSLGISGFLAQTNPRLYLSAPGVDPKMTVPQLLYCKTGYVPKDREDEVEKLWEHVTKKFGESGVVKGNKFYFINYDTLGTPLEEFIEPNGTTLQQFRNLIEEHNFTIGEVCRMRYDLTTIDYSYLFLSRTLALLQNRIPATIAIDTTILGLIILATKTYLRTPKRWIGVIQWLLMSTGMASMLAMVHWAHVDTDQDAHVMTLFLCMVLEVFNTIFNVGASWRIQSKYKDQVFGKPVDTKLPEEMSCLVKDLGISEVNGRFQPSSPFPRATLGLLALASCLVGGWKLTDWEYNASLEVPGIIVMIWMLGVHFFEKAEYLSTTSVGSETSAISPNVLHDGYVEETGDAPDIELTQCHVADNVRNNADVVLGIPNSDSEQMPTAKTTMNDANNPSNPVPVGMMENSGKEYPGGMTSESDVDGHPL